jgi:hypothetical protein
MTIHHYSPRQAFYFDQGTRAYRPVNRRRIVPAVVIPLVTFAIVFLAFAAFIIGALAISLPGGPAAAKTPTATISRGELESQILATVTGTGPYDYGITAASSVTCPGGVSTVPYGARFTCHVSGPHFTATATGTVLTNGTIGVDLQ